MLPKHVGRGILIEQDAGYISPQRDEHANQYIMESKSTF
jgi:hypothetical protein